MKRISLSISLIIISLCTSAQFGARTASQEAEDKLYQVMIGTNKTNASFNNTNGFTTNENEIRIVGFLHRYNKIEFDRITVETRRDGVVIDQQTMKGRSINASWKDFYIKLKDIVFSDHYSVDVYSEPERKFIGTKEFYIKKKKD
jgi:hypothetical protein